MIDDEAFEEAADPFEGDEDFYEVIAEQRDRCETRRVVAALDSEWFARHPEYSRRIRHYVPGEFDNESGGVAGNPGRDFVVLVRRGGVKVLFPVGTFGGRAAAAGGLR